MEECRFYIQLKKLQVLERDDVEEKAEGWQLNDGRENFSKPFRYDARLILWAGGIGRLFKSVDPLARKCLPIPRKDSPGPKFRLRGWSPFPTPLQVASLQHPYPS
jgi:hypothetical protein